MTDSFNWKLLRSTLELLIVQKIATSQLVHSGILTNLGSLIKIVPAEQWDEHLNCEVTRRRSEEEYYSGKTEDTL